MAKNRKKKSNKDDAPATGPSASAASSSASPSGPPQAADIAMKAGNFAAIRIMAKNDDKQAVALLPRTQIDLGQVIVGLIGMLVVLTVAFFTLHGR